MWSYEYYESELITDKNLHSFASQLLYSMNHPLDNPIWNALNTGSAMFSHGNEHCRFVNSEMGFFAGMLSYEKEDIEYLLDTCSLGQRVILFTPGHIELNKDKWLVLNDHDLLQMVCLDDLEFEMTPVPLTELGDQDIPAMIELTRLTKPGPFMERTIDFGGYIGFFEGERLVSMAGKRLCPDPYVEISAECTHPDFLGRGLSTRIMKSVIADIRASGKIPFLHVYPDNFSAVKVYERLGFEARASLRVYLLEKIG